MELEVGTKEKKRVALQTSIDCLKTTEERNRMGQFATPTALAQDIVDYAVSLLPQDVRTDYLEPGFGTGAFYSALIGSPHATRVSTARGFEVDEAYGVKAAKFWESTGLQLTIGDFTKATIPSDSSVNLLICNPPYVRHHHIDNGGKARLQAATAKASDMKLSGLAGLYCHFLGLSHAWMCESGIAVWLIPSEFMDVNYGRAVKEYLLTKVTLLRIHRFEPSDVQFADALVSSAVVCFRKEPPPPDHQVEFTYGGMLHDPHMRRSVSISGLAAKAKWTQIHKARAIDDHLHVPTLSDFFTIKRGIATGDNKFFILPKSEIERLNLPMECFRPILPSHRYLTGDELEANSDGTPVLEKSLFLLDCSLPMEDIRVNYPQLAEYLEEGKQAGVSDGYLCRHRTPWYSQEQRKATPFICTYIGRGDTKTGRPFRFILNHSRAISANVYLLLYPKPPLDIILERHPEMNYQVWQALCQLSPESMIQEGRVYGGGLHKIEPRELGNVPAQSIADLSLLRLHVTASGCRIKSGMTQRTDNSGQHILPYLET